MKFKRINLLNCQPLRAVLIAIVCSMLFLFNTPSALAISSSPSNPRSGETQLDAIYEKSEDALRAEPRTMKELQQEASKGFNEIQGAADLNRKQMNRPENSQQATTAAEEVEEALKKLTQQD